MFYYMFPIGLDYPLKLQPNIFLSSLCDSLNVFWFSFLVSVVLTSQCCFQILDSGFIFILSFFQRIMVHSVVPSMW